MTTDIIRGYCFGEIINNEFFGSYYSSNFIGTISNLSLTNDNNVIGSIQNNTFRLISPNISAIGEGELIEIEHQNILENIIRKINDKLKDNMILKTNRDSSISIYDSFGVLIKEFHLEDKQVTVKDVILMNYKQYFKISVNSENFYIPRDNSKYYFLQLSLSNINIKTTSETTKYSDYDRIKKLLKQPESSTWSYPTYTYDTMYNIYDRISPLCPVLYNRDLGVKLGVIQEINPNSNYQKQTSSKLENYEKYTMNYLFRVDISNMSQEDCYNFIRNYIQDYKLDIVWDDSENIIGIYVVNKK